MVGKVTLSGVLLDPLNKPLPGVHIELKSVKTGDVISGLAAEFVTNQDGSYSVEVPVGSYKCAVIVKDRETSLPGYVNVYEYSGAGTLSEYLYAPCQEDGKPMFIVQWEMIRQYISQKSIEVSEDAKSAKEDAERAESAANTAVEAVDNNFTFSSVEDGLSNTTNGQRFRVETLLDGYTVFKWYRNNNGSALYIGAIPDEAAVSDIMGRVPDILSIDRKIPAFFDKEKNVFLWFEDGMLNTYKIHPSLLSDYSTKDYVDSNFPVIENGINKKFPVLVDKDDNVFMWYEDGMLNTFKLHPDISGIVDVDTGGINTKIPAFVDKDKNVFLWFENGMLNTYKLHPSLLSEYATKEYVDKNAGKALTASTGETLTNYRAKKAQLSVGNSANLKIGFTGDSWTEKQVIPQVFADYLYEKYGKSGNGWLQMNIDYDNLLNGIGLSKSGFSIYDASVWASNPPFPTSMDGQYLYATGEAATMTLSNVFDKTIDIFYYDGDGTFNYSVNDGEKVTVACLGTNKIVSKTISGLDITKATKIVIDTIGNTGTVVIYSFYSKGTGKGVEINKMGNGGITAPQYSKTLQYLPQTASVVNPDLLYMIIGTNDFRSSVSLSSFRDGLTSWVSAWKSACPDTGIILVVPAQCNATGQNPLTAFKEIIIDVAKTLHVEYFSLYDYISTTYSKANSLGLWNDSLHLSKGGARILLDETARKFL